MDILPYARLPSPTFWRVPSLEPLDLDGSNARAAPTPGKHVTYRGNQAKGGRPRPRHDRSRRVAD
jgi:hypothetical protein